MIGADRRCLKVSGEHVSRVYPDTERFHLSEAAITLVYRLNIGIITYGVCNLLLSDFEPETTK
jgi:hypothetical protein